ncbi:LacI family DNA-binding transcriptional regulator [Pseudonocardia sp. HH130630-07]|uniref:LacI family DNA-binding transcriptional regulator n=1 Tax=Pseudonocardia sp. HH130630-07 TaxID=1690815 RepID=UPI0008152046|nr:LacI family DNA-binding transcriptional regulator [Pseudonocardia sp. HH130630-07]ANY09254.1 LacI family transcriptional regulator [Pseudonocardia sp. HH130630-07]
MTTLADVARRAGVSLATASRALNGSAGRTVAPELAERVLTAAADLDYTPNAQAQAMARGRSTTVGLVVHDIADPYFAAIASGVMSAAADRGLLVTVASSERDVDRELNLVEMLRRQRVRAVVLAGSRSSRPGHTSLVRGELAAIRRDGGSVAAIGQDVLEVPTVVVDNRFAAAALARSLYGLGHREFTVLAGPEDLLTARDRAEGFALGLAELGLELAPDRIVESRFDRDGGYAAAAGLAVDGAIAGHCLFVVNDVLALGAVSALRDSGLRVPEDVAVAGFDDIPTLRDVRPLLTTVALPLVKMGRSALELALDSDATAAAEDERIVIGGHVVLRESTRRRVPAAGPQ